MFSSFSMNNPKKVFVSGCFDILHSGHIAFLQEAAHFGDLYVGLGSDKTVFDLKGRNTINSEDERLYMMEALSCVHKVVINKGSGILDFLDDIIALKPDVFVVNEDGHTPEKEQICKDLGIEYKVLKRVPHAHLPVDRLPLLEKKLLFHTGLIWQGHGLISLMFRSFIRLGNYGLN